MAFDHENNNLTEALGITSERSKELHQQFKEHAKVFDTTERSGSVSIQTYFILVATLAGATELEKLFLIADKMRYLR
jgi:hypothetical protein